MRRHAGHSEFFFMDGLSAYNQSKMDPCDTAKISFRTPMGNFHYIVMSFALKNTGSSYQRAMSTIFHDMLYKCLEDYVDDIVMKSQKVVNT